MSEVDRRVMGGESGSKRQEFLKGIRREMGDEKYILVMIKRSFNLGI